MEIKFRVWDKVEKEMMLPAKWEEDYVGGGNKKIGLYIYRSTSDPSQHSSLSWILKHPEHFELLQFIGIKDIKGVDIYAGAIVRLDEDGALPELIGVVEYEEYKAAYWIHNEKTESAFYIFDMTSDSTIEIIGNIHQHPQLLESK